MIRNGVSQKLREIPNDIEATMAEGVQGCDCYATVVGSEYFYFFASIFIFGIKTEATQRIKKFGRKWGTECLNTRFPLPTLLCAEYSVKLINFFFILKENKL